jgi:MFS family permease
VRLPDSLPDAARPIVKTYLLLSAMFNASLALIWGVNTLFLMSAGLTIFQVMLVNATFSLGQFVFEVPTGVVADTIGRRASLLLCLATVLVATLAYLATAWLGLGIVPFIFVSVLLGLGFTFYTGAVDAWMVDAVKHVGYDGPLEPIFARAQAVFGVSMLVGTISGGLLGQLHLYVPYLLRAALLVPTIAVAWVSMHDIGFAARPLRVRDVPAEMKRILGEGVRHGWNHRVVRPLMLSSFVAMSFGMFGFYSWQRYFLDLLGKELVWVTGFIAALVALSGIVGNRLVTAVARVVPRRTSVIMLATCLQAAALVASGLLGSFVPVVACYLLSAVAGGMAAPVRQSLLNANIPSAQRATIISLDSLFGDLGSGLGQTGWGRLAQARGIGASWVAGGAFLLAALPFIWRARRCAGSVDRFAEGAAAQAATATEPDPTCPDAQRARRAAAGAAGGES